MPEKQTTDVPSYVYVIGTLDGPVKIGTARDPQTRLRELQTANPYKLCVLWATPGDRLLEKQLHLKFAPYRLNGEWFDFGDADPVKVVASALDPIPRFVRLHYRLRARWYALADALGWWMLPLGLVDAWYIETALHPKQLAAELHQAAALVHRVTALDVLATVAVLYVARTAAIDLRRSMSASRARYRASVHKAMADGHKYADSIQRSA